MFQFIVLGKFTAQGVADYKQTLNRADASAKAAESMGGRMVDIFWTLGKYDFVAIFDMPDPESMAALLMRVGAQGNIQTATMRAFTREEMPTILAKAAG